MLKIQFEGFAVRFIRSPRSLQAGPLTRSMETQLFSRKCLSVRGRHLFDYGNVWLPAQRNRTLCSIHFLDIFFSIHLVLSLNTHKIERKFPEDRRHNAI